MAAMATATKAELREFLAWCYGNVFEHPDRGEGWFYCPMCRAPYRCVARHILACCARDFETWYASLTDRDADTLNVVMLLRYSDEWEEHQRRRHHHQKRARLALLPRPRNPFFESLAPSMNADRESAAACCYLLSCFFSAHSRRKAVRHSAVQVTTWSGIA